MSRERIQELREDYKKALGRLLQALEEDFSKNEMVVDAVIQRFEFTFELAWKLGKVVLAHMGVEASAPRPVLKEAFKAKLIGDGDGWIDMLEDRNKTAHIYDEKEALKIYQKIKSTHVKLLRDFCVKVEKY